MPLGKVIAIGLLLAVAVSTVMTENFTVYGELLANVYKCRTAYSL